MSDEESFFKKHGLKIGIGLVVVVLLLSVGYATGTISLGGQAAATPVVPPTVPQTIPPTEIIDSIPAPSDDILLPAPEFAPVSAPRFAPVPAPRPAPVPAPRPAPVPAPRFAPVPAPRPAPVSAPRPAPVSAPRPAPVSAPRPAPVPAPVPAPSLSAARYIYIRRIKNQPSTTTSRSENIINLSQIEIYDAQGKKYIPRISADALYLPNTIILPNMTASLSTDYNELYTGGNLINGILNNNLAHTTDLPMGNFSSLGTGISTSNLVQYAMVDLGENVPIGKIVVVNRKDCCQGRILGTELQILNAQNQLLWKEEFLTISKDYTFNFRPVSGISTPTGMNKGPVLATSLYDPSKNYFLYGPSVNGYKPVLNISRLPDNRVAYITRDGNFTKMVANNGEVKYYSGYAPFDPSKWTTYTTGTSGMYRLNVCPSNCSTGCASNGVCVSSTINFLEPYDTNLVPVRYIRFKRVKPSPNGINPFQFWINIFGQRVPAPSTSLVETDVLNSRGSGISVQVSGAVGLSTGVLNRIDNIQFLSANTSNAMITFDLLSMYYLHGVYVYPTNGKAEEMMGVQVEFLNNSQQLVARAINYDVPSLRYNIMYKFSRYEYKGPSQGGLPTNLSGRFIKLTQRTAGIILNIRQIAIYNAQGLRYAPQPLSASQLYPTRYVSFYREYQQYLAAPARAFNLQTNKGFTALALVRFTGTVGKYERIFDFGNGADKDNIVLTRRSTAAEFEFGILSPNWTSTRGGRIVQDAWTLVACRYSAGSRPLFELFQDGVQVGVNASVPTSMPNRTLNMNYIGRSHWSSDAYANMDLAGFMVYDRPLSDTEIATCSSLLRGGAGTLPGGSIYDLRASSSLSPSGVANQDFKPVSGWGPFTCIAPNCSPAQQPLMNALEVVPMTATMSSVYQNSTSAYGPQKLINGNFMDTNFASTNAVATNSMQWMSVDLGAERPISKIVIYNRGLFSGSHWSWANQNDRMETRVTGSTVDVLGNNNAVKWNRRIASGAREYVYQS